MAAFEEMLSKKGKYTVNAFLEIYLRYFGIDFTLFSS